MSMTSARGVNRNQQTMAERMAARAAGVAPSTSTAASASGSTLSTASAYAYGGTHPTEGLNKVPSKKFADFGRA